MAHINLANKDELVCDLNQFKLAAAGNCVQIVTDGQKRFDEKQLQRTAKAAEVARTAGPIVLENFDHRRINFISQQLRMWRLCCNDNSYNRVPRIDSIRSDKSKTDWPMTVERKLKHAKSGMAEVERPPSSAAVDHHSKRSNHG